MILLQFDKFEMTNFTLLYFTRNLLLDIKDLIYYLFLFIYFKSRLID